jgi:nicotinamidase-related amidase
MRKPALLVIDMLQDFLDSWDAEARRKLVESTNELSGMVRSRGFPVIWVRQEFEADLRDAFQEMKRSGMRVTIKGTRGSELVPELQVTPADRVLVKKRYSAFFGTPLDEWLAELEPDGLIIAGVNTHACVRMTSIDAYQRDWEVILAADCVGSYDREHHEVSLRYMRGKIAEVMSNVEIAARLDAGAKP